jgi:hypothetical protein
MPAILTQAHSKRLETLRRVHLELQGETGSILLEKLDPDTRAFVEFLTIEKSFYPFFTRGADGRSLPPDVRFELQIGEEMLTSEDARQVAAVKHGTQRYRVVRGDQAEPGMVPPIGPHRFWRFHIAWLEETA